MPWWSWVLVWLALFVGAGLFLFQIGRSIWREIKALSKEVATATERFSAIDAQLEKLNATAAAHPAIFDDPVHVRMDRAKMQRASRRERRRVR